MTTMFADLFKALPARYQACARLGPGGVSHRAYFQGLKAALSGDPAELPGLYKRLEQVHGRWIMGNNPPANVAADLVGCDMRIALSGRFDAALRPRTGDKKRIMAAARPLLDAERKHAAEVRLIDEGKRAAAREEQRARYVHDRLNVPRRPKGGW
jgi:hypothetical protein